MKTLIIALSLIFIQVSSVKAEEGSVLGVEINTCSVVKHKFVKTYKNLNDCLKRKLWMSVRNPSDDAVIYLWSWTKDLNNIRMVLNWKPILEGRRAMISELLTLCAEYPRELWANLFNEQHSSQLKEVGFKKSFLGNATLKIEEGYTFRDLFDLEKDRVAAEILQDIQKIEISISVLGIRNNHLQYQGELLLNGNLPTQEEKTIQVGISSDQNIIRSRPYNYNLRFTGENATELREVLP